MIRYRWFQEELQAYKSLILQKMATNLNQIEPGDQNLEDR
jgi:hypothetical protein